MSKYLFLGILVRFFYLFITENSNQLSIFGVFPTLKFIIPDFD